MRETLVCIVLAQLNCRRVTKTIYEVTVYLRSDARRADNRAIYYFLAILQFGACDMNRISCERFLITEATKSAFPSK